MSSIEYDHNHCGSCCCGSCQGCLTDIVLTEDEVTVLGKFAQIPFLPVASDGNGDSVYLENDLYTNAPCAVVFSVLQQKHLISIDYDIPLSNYDYQLYRDYRYHGSMALTSFGQYVIDKCNL